MTILKSRLVTPDGKAIVGRRVVATLMYLPSWIEDPNKGGRAFGSVTGYTDAAGEWHIELMPVTQFEQPEYVWYQIDEGEQTWRVKFEESAGEVWLKDHLIDPPPPPPDYIAIDKLGSLHDVDRQSVDNAPDGAILVKRGGIWTAEMPTFGKERLSQLDDVDPTSTTTPPSLSTLQYLGSDTGWGVYKAPSPYPVGRINLPDPSDTYTLRLSWSERDVNRITQFRWGDEPADQWNTWPESEDSITRTFTVEGYYKAVARYQDDPANEGWIDEGGFDVPYEK